MNRLEGTKQVEKIRESSRERMKDKSSNRKNRTEYYLIRVWIWFSFPFLSSCLVFQLFFLFHSYLSLHYYSLMSSPAVQSLSLDSLDMTLRFPWMTLLMDFSRKCLFTKRIKLDFYFYFFFYKSFHLKFRFCSRKQGDWIFHPISIWNLVVPVL